MLKRILSLVVAAMLFAGAMAQNIETTNVQVGDVTAPAFRLSIDKGVDLVQDAMNKRLKDAKLKTKKTDGYIAALDQLFSEISTSPINLYTKVEKDGRNASKVTVCVIPSDLTVDREAMQGNVRNFLADFQRYVSRFEANNNMLAEQDNLKKAQKAQAAAVSVVNKLDKSIKSDQDKIADKKKEIEKLTQKIKDCQEDIKNLEANIVKSQEQKTSAQKDVEKANDNVRNVEAQVEKYRSLAE